jgi:hypothetical protein
VGSGVLHVIQRDSWLAEHAVLQPLTWVLTQRTDLLHLPYRIGIAVKPALAPGAPTAEAVVLKREVGGGGGEEQGEELSWSDEQRSLSSAVQHHEAQTVSFRALGSAGCPEAQGVVHTSAVVQAVQRQEQRCSTGHRRQRRRGTL